MKVREVIDLLKELPGKGEGMEIFVETLTNDGLFECGLLQTIETRTYTETIHGDLTEDGKDARKITIKTQKVCVLLSSNRVL